MREKTTSLPYRPLLHHYFEANIRQSYSGGEWGSSTNNTLVLIGKWYKIIKYEWYRF